MVELTFWKWFVLIGVILATWSASLSNLIGIGFTSGPSSFNLILETLQELVHEIEFKYLAKMDTSTSS
jgi:hypothetical protein